MSDVSIVTLNNTGCPVTTTLSIADGVGNPHASVIRLVRDNICDLEEFGLLDFKSESRGGRPTEIAILNEQQATLLLTYMRNNDVVRAFKKRLVGAFYDLVAQTRAAPLPDLSDPAVIRGLLLTYTEKVIALEARVEDMKGDVAAHDRLTKADGSLNVTEVAKNLGMRPKDLFSWLSRNDWIYKRSGSKNWLGYQDKCNQGLLEHKCVTVSRMDGSEKICEQVMMTPKGISKVTKAINRGPQP